MPKNFFSGVIMTHDVVSTYYPVNYRNPYFDHFVFQPMIDDGTGADDNFTLAAYAVNADGTVLNGQNMLETKEIETNPFPGTKPNTQFANMHLDLTALGILYPPGVKSDLYVYPPGGYYRQNGVETAYVQYVAETGTGTEVVINTKINPSPPY
ncbi:MAG TPA: hypothetical protein VK671_16830 [Mucilaginibacter sp.]|jgi:hypothetical protein|nr:hypothetical protein [Mucilaginibacter sp.]